MSDRLKIKGPAELQLWAGLPAGDELDLEVVLAPGLLAASVVDARGRPGGMLCLFGAGSFALNADGAFRRVELEWKDLERLSGPAEISDQEGIRLCVIALSGRSYLARRWANLRGALHVWKIADRNQAPRVVELGSAEFVRVVAALLEKQKGAALAGRE